MIQLSSCPVCGAAAAECRAVHVRRDDLLVLCPGCGLLFANPQYEPHEIDEIYRHDYYNEEVTSQDGRTVWGGRGGGQADQRHFEVLRSRLVRRYPRLGERGVKVLDYGCGVGQFLSVMAGHGARAVGVESSPVAAKFVREKLGLAVIEGAEEALAAQPEDTFDLVVLLNVLEHLRDPTRVMDLVRRKLSSGGVLCLFVPSTASLVYRLRRGRSRDVRNRTHLALYSRRSLFLLLSKAGLVKIRRLVFWGGRPGFGPIRNFIQYFVRLLGWGSGLFVTAEKA